MDYIDRQGRTKRDKWDKPSSQRELVLPDFDLSQAVCGQTDPELFFPDRADNSLSHLAKQICATCPVRIQCLTWALKNDEEFGIWGGFSPKERRLIKRRGTKDLKTIPMRIPHLRTEIPKRR